MKINTIELIISAVRESQYPTDQKKEFLLVGRSNVGKSSFINSIINRKNYARTSATPGKTQTLNFYKINDEFYLVDAPGYGFAKVRNSLKKKFGLIIENYLKDYEINEEFKNQVIHMVGSHMNEYSEWGALVLPKMLEVIIINYADSMDAYFEPAHKIIKDAKKGELYKIGNAPRPYYKSLNDYYNL